MLEALTGIEPAPTGLRGRRSAFELQGRVVVLSSVMASLILACASCAKPSDVQTLPVYRGVVIPAGVPEDDCVTVELPPMIADEEPVIWLNPICVVTVRELRLLARRMRKADE